MWYTCTPIPRHAMPYDLLVAALVIALSDTPSVDLTSLYVGLNRPSYLPKHFLCAANVYALHFEVEPSA